MVLLRALFYLIWFFLITCMLLYYNWSVFQFLFYLLIMSYLLLYYLRNIIIKALCNRTVFMLSSWFFYSQCTNKWFWKKGTGTRHIESCFYSSSIYLTIHFLQWKVDHLSNSRLIINRKVMFNSLMPGGSKRSYVVKQTCS